MNLGNLFQYYRSKRLCFLVCIWLAILSFWVLPCRVQANPARPGVFQATQPDGSTVMLRAHGDEYFNWLEDGEGYTVLTDPITKKYVYGRLNAEQRLERTGHEVGKVSPQAVGLAKKLLPPKAVQQQIRKEKQQSLKVLGKNDQITTDLSGNISAHVNGSAPGTRGSFPMGMNAAPAAPVELRIVKNLVLLVAFNDHYDSTNFTVRQEFGFEAEDYEPMFNNLGPHALAPTGSIKDYFEYNSAGQVILESKIHPSWIKLPQNEAFYINNPQQMAIDALDRVDPALDFTPFDDGEGLLQSLTILHSGYDASGGAVGVWSHASTGILWTSAEGITAWGYYTGPALWGVQEDPKQISRFGVFVHEIGHHVFSLPDLYDTDGSSEGIGNWGLMGGGSWGFDGSQLRPSHLSAWSKDRVGWITPQLINDITIPDPSGLYTVSDWDTHLNNISANPPVTDSNPVYRVDVKYENLTVRSSISVGDIIGATFFPSPLIGISEFTYTGSSDAVGIFRGGIIAGLDFESGIVLGTGNVTQGRGPNKEDVTTNFGLAGDDAVGTSINPEEPPATQDAAAIAFTIQLAPDIDFGIVGFNFSFASEEFADATLPLDNFACVVDDVILVPAVWGASNLNPPGDEAVFNIQYNGFSSVATAIIPLDAAVDYDNEEVYETGLPHTIKIVIADVANADGEFLLDSALFIESGSFSDIPILLPPEPVTEYLLIENRQPIGFETDLPQGGLAIWHVDELIGSIPGNTVNQPEGFPGQSSFIDIAGGEIQEVFWPENNRHYRVALLQADGNYNLEGQDLFNRGDSGDLYHADGVDTLHEFTVPNTDNYQWGVVDPTHISISKVSSADSEMCFVYRGGISGVAVSSGGSVSNDDFDHPLPVECGEFLLDGQWIDETGCGWEDPNNSSDCSSISGSGLPDNIGDLGIPVDVECFRITGSTQNALLSWIPGRTDPTRTKHASQCAGYDVFGEPVDPIDIWHTFTPARSGFVTFELCSSSNSNFDTTLEVFSDPNGPVNGNLPIACNDDVEFTDPACFHQSRLTTYLQADQTYLIRIAGYNDEVGDYTLSVCYSDFPEHDECESAVVLTEGVPFNGTTSGATSDITDVGGTGDGFDVWHQYTPAQSGAVTLSLCGSDFDTTLAVFNNDCNSVSELAFNDDCADDPFNLCESCGMLDSRLVFDMTAGETYLIRVAGYANEYGDYTLTLTSAPQNDLCENAIYVSDFNVFAETFTGSTQYATPTLTSQNIEMITSCGGDGDTIDVWYSYRPAVSETVKVSLCGSDFDTTLAIYDACGGTEFELTCNDDACGLLGQQSELDMAMIAGETYLIRVSGFGEDNSAAGKVGDYILRVMGGEGNGQPLLSLDPPYEYTWVQDQPINVCLPASGGEPPYTLWTATMLDTSNYNNLGSMPFVAGGVAQSWQADDGVWNYTLPFTFTYFGNNYTTVNVTSNGFLDFVSSNGTPLNTEQGLIDNVRIAPMWDELSTDPAQGNPGDDIYIDESVADQVTIRWQGINRMVGPASPVNFAVTLFASGRVQFDYGAGNTSLTPTVGISAGNGQDYFLITGHNGAASLGDADTILYIPGDPVPPVPTGVTLNTLTGCLTGSPTELGVFEGFFQVTDSNQDTASHNISFVVTTGVPGDINFDSVIDFVDYALFVQQWALTDCAPANEQCAGADMNAVPDGEVNLLDLAILLGNWLD